MKPQYSFFTGLPRSGSTVFGCVLNQNPDLFVSTNSHICNTLFKLKQVVINNPAYQSNPDPEALNESLKSVLPTFYKSKQDKKIIFDKAFAWGNVENYSMLKEVLNCRPKFVVFNRNINNVIDSIIKLIYKLYEYRYI